MPGRSRMSQEINSGSMADIAFLLLIFFLVTTTIASDKGITLLLPPKPDDVEQVDIEIPERNLFKVLVNSKDKLLVEGEPLEDVQDIREMVKEFVLNYGKPSEEMLELYNSLPPELKAYAKNDPESADSPDMGKAVVSFKTDRGTSYDMYIKVLDELKGAYYEIYAARAGVTADEYRLFSAQNPREKELLDKGKEGIPMQISIAEPSNVSQ